MIINGKAYTFLSSDIKIVTHRTTRNICSSKHAGEQTYFIICCPAWSNYFKIAARISLFKKYSAMSGFWEKKKVLQSMTNVCHEQRRGQVARMSSICHSFSIYLLLTLLLCPALFFLNNSLLLVLCELSEDPSIL